MEFNAKCDPALLGLLQRAPKKDVDFLVDVLTANGSGRVALSSSIKDMLLAEKHQAESHYSTPALRHLLHELQEFGGHSLINMFRSEPVAYKEILNDVHKKLNGRDSKSKNSAQKEREIVVGLFGRDWEQLEDPERLERSTQTKVIAGFFQLSSAINVDEKGAVIGLTAAASAALFVALKMIPVAGAASTLGPLYQAVGEAYRVTIPFVAQIAYIKMSEARGRA